MKGKKQGAGRRRSKPAPIAREWDDGQESLDLYLKDISKIPLLKIEEERALGRRAYRGEKRAQEELARRVRVRVPP